MNVAIAFLLTVIVGLVLGRYGFNSIREGEPFASWLAWIVVPPLLLGGSAGAAFGMVTQPDQALVLAVVGAAGAIAGVGVWFLSVVYPRYSRS